MSIEDDEADRDARDLAELGEQELMELEAADRWLTALEKSEAQYEHDCEHNPQRVAELVDYTDHGALRRLLRIARAAMVVAREPFVVKDSQIEDLRDALRQRD